MLMAWHSHTNFTRKPMERIWHRRSNCVRSSHSWINTTTTPAVLDTATVNKSQKNTWYVSTESPKVCYSSYTCQSTFHIKPQCNDSTSVLSNGSLTVRYLSKSISSAVWKLLQSSIHQPVLLHVLHFTLYERSLHRELTDGLDLCLLLLALCFCLHDIVQTFLSSPS